MISKKFAYKIYDSLGAYITTWADVQSEPEFSIPINGAFSEMQIKLARPLDSFGENQDVKYGNVLKLYAFDVDSGQNGVLIYSGFISMYEPLVDGGKEEIVVTVVSWWWELNRYLLEGDGNGIDALIYGNGFGSNACALMTANNAPSPNVVSASTEYAGFPAWLAFNRSLVLATYDTWFTTAGNTTGWLKYDFGVGNAKVITKYTIVGVQNTRNTAANELETPKNWTFEGSNTGAFAGEQTILDTQTNESDWKINAKKEYSFENQDAFRYYRINITANNGGTIVGIAEMEMIESVAFAKLNATSIRYEGVDPSNILKDVLDKFTAQGGKVDYAVGTVDLTATVASYLFNTNTVQEAVEKIIELCPQDWYFRLGADDKLYLKPKSGSVDHKFHIGRSVSYYRQEKRLENITNFIYFKGKNFYKKYQNSGSVAAYGRYSQKIVNENVLDVATADLIADAILDKMASPEIRITVKIIDSNNADGFGYDIETIKVGDTCKIFNATSKAENLWDSIMWDVDAWDYDVTNTAGTVLQIQKITYHPDYAELEISNRQPDLSKRIEDISKKLVDSQTINNPVIPQ